MDNKNREIENLIIIAGPTGVGKTSSSISIAKYFSGEIISSDSMQVYKGFDIGSAKIKKEEMSDITHHMLDVCKASDSYNVSLYSKDASKIINTLIEKNIQPIIVGGTGLYIHSLLHKMHFNQSSPDYEFRQELENYLHEHGAVKLHEKLAELSPETSEAIHPNNTKKVIRAIEILKNNNSHTEFVQEYETDEFTNKFNIGTKLFVLDMNREKLYNRINNRVDEMIEEGLVEEVKSLVNKGLDMECQSMNGIGYKEIYSYIIGETTLETAIEKIKQNSRKYAKRQLTWFRRYPFAIWIDVENKTPIDIILEIQSYLI